ncbi:hypothetical protein LUQ84_3471 [Hamiltosporidium tvaerminnensis]|nr:hypothetical protein LUQ84_3471 [Hamiltosporidium tvaerminnensis]
MDKKTRRRILIIGGIFLFLAIFITYCIFSAKKRSENFQKEYEKFINSKQGALILEKCSGMINVVTTFGVEEYFQITPALSVCAKQKNIHGKILDILHSIRISQNNPREYDWAIECFDKLEYINLPYIFDIPKFKKLGQQYKVNIFTNIGLLFYRKNTLFSFFIEYIGNFNKKMINLETGFPMVEQTFDENCVDIEYYSLEYKDKYDFDCSIRYSRIPDRSKQNPLLGFLIFIMYKSHQNRLQEYFLKILDIVGVQLVTMLLTNFENFIKKAYESYEYLFYSIFLNKSSVISESDSILSKRINDIEEHKKVEDFLDFFNIIFETSIRVVFRSYLHIEKYEEEVAKEKLKNLATPIIEMMTNNSIKTRNDEKIGILKEKSVKSLANIFLNLKCWCKQVLEDQKKENKIFKKDAQNNIDGSKGVNEDIAAKLLKKKILENLPSLKEDLETISSYFFIRYKYRKNGVMTDENVMFAILDCLLRNAISSLDILLTVLQ